MMKSLFFGMALIACMPFAEACIVQPFTGDSMVKIEKRYEGKPYVVALWSLTCPPCMHELKMLSQWHAENSDTPLVLISTDGQSEQGEVITLLSEMGLQEADNWLFADTYVEKLRFKIDSSWRGELPRSYLYSSGGERNTVSGELKRETLDLWQKTQGKAVSTEAPN